MAKLIGKNKIQCAVFISGRGSNLKSIYKYSKKKNSKINIKLVVSNNINAPGLIFAKKMKIKTKVVKYDNKFKSDIQIINILKINRIELICLAGFMRILSKKFIINFKNKIINIHPSLLPKYKGLNTHERAIKNKDKYSGCTVHFVNEKLDSGNTIIKKSFFILPEDNEKSLKIRTQLLEHKAYPEAIIKIFRNN